MDHNFYSVPHQLGGKRVYTRATASIIEIFFRSHRIASHARLEGRGRYSTVKEHMPISHRGHLEWTPSRLIRWAETTGPATGVVVAEILKSRPLPEQGSRSCLGIMRLSERYGPARMEAACVRAQQLELPATRPSRTSSAPDTPTHAEHPSNPPYCPSTGPTGLRLVSLPRGIWKQDVGELNRGFQKEDTKRRFAPTSALHRRNTQRTWPRTTSARECNYSSPSRYR